MRSESSVRTTVTQTLAAFGRLDLLVNNAAVFASAALESLALEQWDAVFEINARGPFLVAREALPYLRAAQGRIVNIGSLGALHAWPGHAHYCASKAALHMLTQTMAKAFAPEVSVNCVAPGWIEADNIEADIIEADNSEAVNLEADNLDAADSPTAPSRGAPQLPGSEAERRASSQAARFAAKTPMGRNGAANDVAQAVLFFATGPHFITGQTLAVNGGLGLA